MKKQMLLWAVMFTLGSPSVLADENLGEQSHLATTREAINCEAAIRLKSKSSNSESSSLRRQAKPGKTGAKVGN